jgi:hypothetical protein
MKPRKTNGRGENRRYSAEEICRVALAYWFFRTGLRGPFITAILTNRRVSSFIAQLNTFRRIQSEAARQRSLVAWRFTTTRKAKKWKVEVEGCEFVKSLRRAPNSVRNHGCVILPVGSLLQQLTDKMLD